MEHAVVRRIKLLFEKKNINANKFGNKNDAAIRRYQRQLKGESSLSLEFIVDIIDAFEDLSAEWLLRGEGEMFRCKAKSETEDATTQKLLETQQELIDMQREKITMLTEKISELEKKMSVQTQKVA